MPSSYDSSSTVTVKERKAIRRGAIALEFGRAGEQGDAAAEFLLRRAVQGEGTGGVLEREDAVAPGRRLPGCRQLLDQRVTPARFSSVGARSVTYRYWWRTPSSSGERRRPRGREMRRTVGRVLCVDADVTQISMCLR
ncbi:hypothetical protein [Streptomyces echinatus]|uniref:Uncharacterized protein n=1 Tax=Streptomyces echinatus TaxID=67293 RepID=A0A7W9URB9_9ACTN|nr:hypothetical protein [Streptomyces echinatus]